MKTICLDFDGVCNTYDGWRGEAELFQPRPGLREFIVQLTSQGFQVVIHSTRPTQAIVAWLTKHDVRYISNVTNTKPPALVYLDDRGVTFKGDFNAAYGAIMDFKAYWEAGPSVTPAPAAG